MSELYHWDLSKMFKNEEEINSEIKKVNANLSKLEELKKDAKNKIYEILDLRTIIYRSIDKLTSYSSMKRDENSKIPESQKLAIEMDSLYSKVEADMSFLSPCLLSLTKEEWNKLKEDKRYNFYKIFFDRILREKEHMLSEDMEYIMSSYSDVTGASHNSFYMLSYADMKFPDLENTNEKLSHATFVKLLTDKKRELRKETFEKFYDTYQNYENTFASTLYGNMKGVITESKLRKFNSAREMALFADDVDIKVYDSLIESVHKALPSIHDYFALKKKVLGLDEYHMYDIYTNISDYDRIIPFEEAKEIVLKALQPMGEEYCSIIKKAFEENWIDVYPQDGKRSGAYSGGCYDSAPYILMNYNENLSSVFTLIHELGHSVHSYMSKKNNEFIYSSYTIFVAEVASTTNEMLLINYLLNNTDNKDEKIYLLNYYADMFKSTVFRQTMFAEFEKIVHEKVENGEALTAEDFNNIYYELNKLYFGENVEVDDRISLEWARIPHFYRDFYVYKYATGLSAAAVISKKILDKEENALENYFEFLKDGNNNFPIKQLQKAGADMSNPKTVEEGLLGFKEKVEELKKIIG